MKYWRNVRPNWFATRECWFSMLYIVLKTVDLVLENCIPELDLNNTECEQLSL